MAEHRFYQVTPSGELNLCADLPKALAALQSGGYLWLDFRDPTREDLLSLIDPMVIHPLALEDCLDEFEIAKMEEYPGNTFILFNVYKYAGQELTIGEVDFFLGPKFLITVSGHDGQDSQLSERLESRIALERAAICQGPDFLLHLMIDYLVDDTYLAVEAIEEEIDEAEECILQTPAKFRLDKLANLRRDLLSLRKSLFHEREILVKICRRDSPYISEKSIYHFRDIYDHLTKFFEEVEIYREMIVSLMEMYLSMINNKMALVANKTNITLRRLTFITTIFMPLTLLAGIGGMSEWSMITGPENWMFSYPFFILLMVVIGVLSYVFLRWLDRKSEEENRKCLAE